MTPTVTFLCKITSVAPSGDYLLIVFTLTSPSTLYSQTYDINFDTAMLGQGVTDQMSDNERAAQVQNNFWTIIEPILITFGTPLFDLVSAKLANSDVAMSQIAS